MVSFQIDIMPIHYYGTNADDMITYIEKWYNQFQLPIVITEFACQVRFCYSFSVSRVVFSFLFLFFTFRTTTPPTRTTVSSAVKAKFGSSTRRSSTSPSLPTTLLVSSPSVSSLACPVSMNLTEWWPPIMCWLLSVNLLSTSLSSKWWWTIF